MKKVLFTFMAPLLGMMLLLLGAHLFNAPPKYKTVPLAVWLAGFDPGAGTQARLDAKEAVKALQLKCVPVLMDYLKAEESQAQKAVSKKINTSALGATAVDPPTLQHRAVAAFEILGTNAAAAVPDLRSLLERPEAAESAAKALSFLGPETVGAFQEGLTNENKNVRAIAAESLGRHARADSVPLLLGALKDPDGPVRGIAATSLGAFPEKAEQIVPALIPLLSDADRFVKHSAAKTLGNFGPRASAAIPHLKMMIQGEVGSTPGKTALARISLEEARAAGLKAVPGAVDQYE